MRADRSDMIALGASDVDGGSMNPILDWLLRIGYSQAIFAVTLFSTVISVAMSFVQNVLKDDLYPVSDWLVPSSIAPLLITPFVAGMILALAYRLQETKAALSKAAMTDALTGVLNRRRITEHARSVFAVERPQQFSILLIDIDHFKSINDTYGHATGDAALIAVSQACLSRLRGTDMFCRWGGEEFLAILPGAELGSAVCVANDLRRAIEDAEVPGTTKRVTASIGVSSLDQNIRSFEAMLKEADRQLYLAKANGRNRTMPG